MRNRALTPFLILAPFVVVAAPAAPPAGTRPPASAAGASSLPAEAAALPGQAEIVFYADVKALRTPAGLLDMRRSIPFYPRAWRRLDDILAAGGLSLREDVDRFAMAAGEGGGSPGMVITLTGRIAEDRFRGSLTKKGWTAQTAGQDAVLVSPDLPLPRGEGKGAGAEQGGGSSAGAAAEADPNGRPGSAPAAHSERLAAAFPAKGIVVYGDRDWATAWPAAGREDRPLGRATSRAARLAGEAAGRPGAAWLVAATPRAAQSTFRRLVPPSVGPLVAAVAEVDTLLVHLSNS